MNKFIDKRVKAVKHEEKQRRKVKAGSAQDFLNECATFEMFSGGPSQTHVGTGGGGSSFDMPWGERKRDINMGSSKRKRKLWSQTNKKTNFFTRELQISGVFFVNLQILL